MDEDLDLDSILDEFEDNFDASPTNDDKNDKSEKDNESGKTTETKSLEEELKAMKKKMEELQKKLEEKKEKDVVKRNLTEVNIFETKEEENGRKEKAKNENVVAKLSKELFGDLESSDEESEKYPLENRGLNEFGKFIKEKIGNSKQNDFSARNIEARNSGKTASTKTKREDDNVIMEIFSGIRLINPLISSAAIKDKMESRRLVRMSSLHNFSGDKDSNWVTIGVIVGKTETKKSSSGKTFSVWRLSDLRDCSKIVAFFLFGKVHQTHWKIPLGQVVGILNATAMDNKESSKTSSKYGKELCFIIDHQDKVLQLGTSKDFAHCRARKKDGMQCTMIVNKDVCEYCQFHIQSAYKRLSSKRSELQSSYSGAEPSALKKKILQNQEIFYGGQTFTTSSTKTSQPKKKKDLMNFSSAKLQQEANDLKRDFENSKHLSQQERNLVSNISSQSEAFGEMLSVPSVGSRNLLKHLTVENNLKNNVNFQSISAAELLKLHQKKLDDMKRQKEKDRSTCLSSIPLKPKIGLGLSVGDTVCLDFVPKTPKSFLQRSEIAKLKAKALIREKGKIIKENPNAVKKIASPGFLEKIKKRIEEEEENGNETPAKRPRLNEQLGSEELKRVINQRSIYADLLKQDELEEEEKYFNNLEQKEKIETKMQEISEIQCKAVSCKVCKYTALSASDVCKSEGHVLSFHKAVKRFFRCKNCKQRTLTLDRIPTRPCSNCGERNYEKTGMKNERRGPTLDNETLSIRGVESKFLNSLNTKGINIHL